MSRSFKKIRAVIIRWCVLLLSILIGFCILLIRARPIVISYAQCHAKALMISAFDSAVKSSIASLDYKYNDVAVISRTNDNLVSSIEIDYQKLNVLRAEISSRITQESQKNADSIISIPLGSLLGSEYTAGYGPNINFRLKFSQMPVLDFSSKFTSAGINSVFHQIIINADLSCSIIMLGADKSFSVKLTAVAAQTVISGVVPDNFTNVIETPESNVADDIFNFSEK